MDELLGYCGLTCGTCTIYLATREKEDGKKHKMRIEISQEIKKHYGWDCKPEDVNDCDGCTTGDGRLFWSCKNCEVRKCARRKGVENCAHCSEYPCEKLKRLYAIEPHGKERLDKIRSGS